MKTLIHIEDVEAIVDKLIDSDSEAATFMIELRKRLVAEEEAEKKEKAPRKKYDLIGLVMDTDPTALVENEVFVLKVEEGTDHNEVPNKIRAVIRDHNVKANANKQARDISNGFALATVLKTSSQSLWLTGSQCFLCWQRIHSRISKQQSHNEKKTQKKIKYL